MRQRTEAEKRARFKEIEGRLKSGFQRMEQAVRDGCSRYKCNDAKCDLDYVVLTANLQSVTKFCPDCGGKATKTA